MISIFTTLTSPEKRGDMWRESIDCYEDLADEVVVIDGDNEFNREAAFFRPTKVESINYEWPTEFDWPFIGQQFQRGYEACTGDWIIHSDLDFIFHENDFKAIRKACEDNNDQPALSFWKYQFILPDRYNLKSRLVIAVNKGKFGDRIKFNSGGDLAQPSLDGKYIKPDDIPESRVAFYNYDFLCKTKEQIIDDITRMDRAYHSHFDKWLYSKDGTEESAYEGWLNMMVGRFHKPSKHLKPEDHPKYIQDTIKNLRPDQWGFSGFGTLERNDYVKSRRQV